MRPAGILLMVVGVWVTTQVFAGNALQRMGVLPKASSDGGGSLIPKIPGAAAPGKDDILPNLPGGSNNPAVPTLPGLNPSQGWIKPL